MDCKTFNTGGVTIRFECGEPPADHGFFRLFRTEGCEPDVRVRVLRQPLPAVPGSDAPYTSRKRRIKYNGAVYNYTCFADQATHSLVPYACEERRGEETTLFIDYHPDYALRLSRRSELPSGLTDYMLFDGISLPDLMLENSAAVIHSSFIAAGEDGLLFAGAKQQGKSTQAALWEKFAGATVINGDRAAVRPGNGGFYAYGVPYCGSSKICLNRRAPLKAVIFPEKCGCNSARLLTGFEAFKRLIGCVSYTEDDPAAAALAVDMTGRIASSVPCVLLRCTPDERSVQTLRRFLSAV